VQTDSNPAAAFWEVWEGAFWEGRQQTTNKQAVNNRFGSAQGEQRSGILGSLGREATDNQ
jgi:hypothetical protein